MNYHLMLDEKFIDDFIAAAESVSAGKNVYYVRGEKSTAQHVTHPAATFVGRLDNFLERFKNIITGTDTLCIHWLHDGLHDLIFSLDKNTRVVLFFWGGEIVADPEEYYIRVNCEPSTLAVYNQYYRKKPTYFRITRNPLNIWKNHQKKKDFDKVIIERVEEKYRILSRVNVFCHWNPIDYEWIKARVKGFDAQFVYHYYGIGLDTDLPETNTGKASGPLVFWLGNSATLSNNHLDALNALAVFRDEHIKIFCPLSYGEEKDSPYLKAVLAYGKELFGDKFIPLWDYMSRKEYYRLLRETDIAVMYHNRTQAAGNIGAFILMDKPVLMQPQSTIYELLVESGVTVFENKILKTKSFTQLKDLKNTIDHPRNQQLLKEKIFNPQSKLVALQTLLN